MVIQCEGAIGVPTCVRTVAANCQIMFRSLKELPSSSINYMELSYTNALDFNIKFTTQITCGIVRLLYQYKAGYF